MSITPSAAAERRAFALFAEDGTADALASLPPLFLAAAPLAAESYGDAVGVGLAFAAASMIAAGLVAFRRRVLSAYLGSVRFSKRGRLRSVAVAAAVCAGALAALVAYWAAAPKAEESLRATATGAAFILTYAGAAFALASPRFALYGAAAGAAAPSGLVAYRLGLAGHRGWPLCFGVAGGLIAASALVRLALFARRHAGARGRPDRADG